MAKNTFAVPATSATRANWTTVSRPSAAATGTLRNAAMDTQSATSMMRRREPRSTQAPAGRPMTSHGSQAAAASTLTASGGACRTVTATSGSATEVTELPRLLTLSPVHNSRNSRSRRSPRRAARRPAAGDSVGAGDVDVGDSAVVMGGPVPLART
ncbi:hypothetical protein SAMN05421678_101235 [Actinopolymorpha cephalotaxi]|uniref:Uncharacterized protein n=1 Tax=Actinopolymorpha cephalotaxi TaxID=504797 RepID=A0A1I2KJU6_9ACTN|nr:hypothetical protein [Actinopolymorpha cephalotaxi]NYH81151.1 hypothetical protein [Actinopolymorpha cephalotaxi]SFF65206.1 hypothetical protein SAMN05421678_101235 [Actinopolymorpha cephalotaxi]